MTDQPRTAAGQALVEEIGWRENVLLIEHQAVAPVVDALRTLLEAGPYDLQPISETELCRFCYTTPSEPHADDCAWVAAEKLIAAVPVSVPVQPDESAQSEREDG